MKLSIIIAILNSHKVVVRQIRHFKRMNLPDTVEIIFVDDGSDPPLSYQDCGLKNFHIYYTNDKRPWTQGLARNLGASNAKGEYLLFTDIDHIITKEAIEAALAHNSTSRIIFPRHYGILSRKGDVVCDQKSMIDFGLNPARLRRRGLFCGHHGNTYVVKKEIFDLIGGYDPKYCTSMFHVGGKFMSEDRKFNIKWSNQIKHGRASKDIEGPKIYFYPVGRFRTDGDNNPFGLFHGLSLEQVPQPMIK